MKITLQACIVLLLLLCFNTVRAQTDTTAAVDTIAIDTVVYFDYSAPSDSSFYDMGRMRLQKKFTQGITIKAADLEKMPFMDLREALAVYYNGIYGSNQKFVYVINGLLNSDVNAYSIYDIDEVTFVQSAANALNGVLPSQVLVLVKTKHGGPGASGVTVNAQTDRITRYVPFIETTTKNFDNSGRAASSTYYQYNVSAYTSSSWIRAGLSATMQHNVYPAYRPANDYWDLVFKPYLSNRFKFNGFVDIKIDTFNVMSLNLGYAPQRDGEGRKRLVPILSTKIQAGSQRTETQSVMYANFNYKSTIAERFTNNFSAGFQRLNLKGTIIADNNLLISDTIGKVTNYTIKNDLDYRFELGDFVVTPQLNLTYRNATDTSNLTYYLVADQIRGYNQTQRLLTVTPSIAFNLKDIFLVQLGAQRALFAKNNFIQDRIIIKENIKPGDGVFFDEYTPKGPAFNNSTATPILPFASVSVDLLKTAYKLSSPKVRSKPYDPTGALLMLYGSFARTASYTSDLYGALGSTITESPDSVEPVYEPYNTGKTYNQIEGGLTYALLKKGLSLSYNYSNSRFNTAYYTRGTFGNPPDDSARLTIANIEIHRLSISYLTPGDHNFKWTTNVNGAFIINKGQNLNYFTEQMRAFYREVDDQLYIKPIITGGFVNQLAYKRAYLGFSVLYGFKKPSYKSLSNVHTRFVDYGTSTHVLNLQNAYIGYQLKLFDWIKSLDVFVNARTLWQNYSGSQSHRHYSFDESRYYGGGIKLTM